MTDSRFLASSLFAMSLIAVPGPDVADVGIEGVSLASGAGLKLGKCNEVRVFVKAARTYHGNARVQLVLREADGDLVFSGTRMIDLEPGAGHTLVFDGIPVHSQGRHLLLASALAGDATESVLGFNVEGRCNA